MHGIDFWRLVTLARFEYDFTQKQSLAEENVAMMVGDRVGDNFIVAAPTQVAPPDFADLVRKSPRAGEHQRPLFMRCFAAQVGDGFDAVKPRGATLAKLETPSARVGEQFFGACRHWQRETQTAENKFFRRIVGEFCRNDQHLGVVDLKAHLRRKTRVVVGEINNGFRRRAVETCELQMSKQILAAEMKALEPGQARPAVALLGYQPERRVKI